MTNQSRQLATDNRRDFLRESLLLAAIPVGLVGSIAQAGAQSLASRPLPELRLGLLGCGRRGLQLTQAALACWPSAKLVALADVFPDKIQQSYRTLNSSFSSRLAIDSGSRLIGMRAYEQLATSDVDAVIIAAPPGQRSAHVKLLAESGKHLYVESPLAINSQSSEEVAGSIQTAIQRGLSICCGLQHRMQPFYQSIVDELHRGAIGSVLFGRVSLAILPEVNSRRSKSMSEFEWRLRNWQFDSRVGGHPLTQYLTGTLDLLNWVVGDMPTVQSVSKLENGFEIQLQYANGPRVQFQIVSASTSNTPKLVCQLQGAGGWVDLASGRVYDQANRVIASASGSPHDIQPVLNAWLASITCSQREALLRRQACLADASIAANQVALQAEAML
jgi:predicted dehydrogenase